MRGPLEGDVDGDGTVDRVYTVGTKSTDGPCRYALKVVTSRGTFRKSIGPGIPGGASLDVLTPLLLFHLLALPGRVVYVQLYTGASGQSGTLFALRGSRLERIRVEGRQSAPDFGAFSVADEGSGVDCVPDSALLVEGNRVASVRRPYFFKVSRVFYRRHGDTFMPVRRRHIRQVTNWQRFPELNGDATPFPDCPKRIPATGMFAP